MSGKTVCANKTSKTEANDRFKLAIKLVREINNTKAEDTELGTLYGLYKQSTVGDCNISKPNKLLDYKGYKKWEYWKNYKGKSQEDSMTEYADYVVDLIDKYGLKKK